MLASPRKRQGIRVNTRASPDVNTLELEKPKKRRWGVTQDLRRTNEILFVFWDELSAEYGEYDHSQEKRHRNQLRDFCWGIRSPTKVAAETVKKVSQNL